MKKRIEIVNSVIKKIAEYDRKFFLNKEGKGNIGNFQLKEDKLYYQDEWKKTTKQIRKGMHWGKLTWVNHGGTVSAQVMQFADFIFTGKKQEIHSMYWGYCVLSLIEIHKFAFEVGLIPTADFWIYDYGISERQYVKNGKVVTDETQ